MILIDINKVSQQGDSQGYLQVSKGNTEILKNTEYDKGIHIYVHTE